MLVLVAAALLIVPPLLAPSPSPSTRAPTPIPTVSPSPELSIVPAPSVELSPFTSVEWTVEPFAAPDAQLSSVLTAGSSVVALGTTAAGELTAWSSQDGGAGWQAAVLPIGTPPVDGAVARMGAAAASGDQIVVICLWIDPATSAVAEGLALRSEDLGDSWEAAAVEPAGIDLGSIAATADGLVAVGFDETNGSAGMWASPDGVSWEPVDAVGLPDETLRAPAGPAGGPGGLLVAGALAEGRTDSHPAAWYSSDGAHWQLTYEDPLISGRFDQLWGGNFGFLGTGQTFGVVPGGAPSIWISPDGRSWTARGFSDLAGLQIGSAAMNSAGVVMTAEGLTTGADTTIRFLRGGSDEFTDANVPIIRPMLVALEDGFVAIGSCPDDGTCQGLLVATGRPE